MQIFLPPCTFFSGSWRVARGSKHDAERSEAKCFEPRCVLSIAVTSGTEPTCRERPSTPCVSNTWGGPVPRRAAAVDARRESASSSASTGNGEHRGGSMPTGDFGMEDERNWFVGVDWASETHHVRLWDAKGRKVGERAFAHGGQGLAEMVAWILKLTGATPDAVFVAIEVPHGPVVESLMERGFRVHAINRWILTRSATPWGARAHQGKIGFSFPFRRLPLHFEMRRRLRGKEKSSRLKVLGCCTSRRNSGSKAARSLS